MLEGTGQEGEVFLLDDLLFKLGTDPQVGGGVLKLDRLDILNPKGMGYFGNAIGSFAVIADQRKHFFKGFHGLVVLPIKFPGRW